MQTGVTDDGLCGSPAIVLRPGQLVGTVCIKGGAHCPLLEQAAAEAILRRLEADPTATIRLVADADTVPYFRAMATATCLAADPSDALSRKRDLDVLQRLGLAPGDTRRGRYLYTLLFERIATPCGLCAYDTPGWQGCPLARSGAYEAVRAAGWEAIVHARSDAERAESRQRNAAEIAKADRLYVRPHHLMCLSCWYNGGSAKGPRPNDTIYEILLRIREQPDIPLTLVEGPCMACDCCDGLHPANGRCVHDCGLIRDYKKDLDLFQKLGLLPGATLPARDFIRLLFGRIASTREICGYGDGVVRSREWSICGDPAGNPGYARTRETGLF